MRISDWSSDVCSSDLDYARLARTMSDWRGFSSPVHSGRISESSKNTAIQLRLMAEPEELPRPELVNTGVGIGFTRTQHHRREILFIGRIGKMLGLQTKSRPEIIRLSSFAGNGSVQKIPPVELDTWFGGINLNIAAALNRKDVV